MNKQLAQRLQHYFKSHTKSNKCYVTSDETIFHEKEPAEAHAQSLSKKEVAEYNRAGIEDLIKDALKGDDSAGDEPKSYSKMNKKELTDELDKRGISYDKNDTNKQMAELLTEYDKGNKLYIVDQAFLDNNPDAKDLKIGDRIFIEKDANE